MGPTDDHTHEDDVSVTVIGTGALGSAVTRRLLATGRSVAVWNRTPDRTSALVDAGAVAVTSLADAVATSDLTLLTVTDYDAVLGVLDQLDGDLSGHTIVVLATGTPDDADRASQRAAGLGATYLDAGVQTAPEDIGTDRATLLYSGPAAAFEQARPTLRLLGTPRFVGESPRAAATWDLALFGLWYDAQLGLLRALETATRAGIDLDAFADTAATQLGHVVQSASTTAGELRSAEYPRGPADLEEHRGVMDQLAQLRAASAIGDGGLLRVTDVIDALIAEGRGHQGLTAVVGASAH